MTPNVFVRCHFVVKEIHRVALACEALDNGNIEALGKLLFETHEGLSKEYLVSCDELDFIVDTLKKEKAVIGSRLMGGGFGGCTINLIKKGEEEAIKTKLTKLYKEAFDIELKIYDVKIGNGTSLYQIRNNNFNRKDANFFKTRKNLCPCGYRNEIIRLCGKT